MNMLPRASDTVVCSDVGDGAVLLDTATEIYFGLNSTGAAIWRLLADAGTPEALIAGLLRLYPEAPVEALEADVRELLDELASHGLVVADQPA